MPQLTYINLVVAEQVPFLDKILTERKDPKSAIAFYRNMGTENGLIANNKVLCVDTEYDSEEKTATLTTRFVGAMTSEFQMVEVL